MTAWFGLPWVHWLLVPFLIFLARMSDVTLGTIRIIFVSRGMRWLAPLVGFVEISIWLVAVRTLMQNLDRYEIFFAYAAGFSLGTFVGITIESHLAMGMALIRIITPSDTAALREALRGLGYDMTAQSAQGLFGPVQVLLSVVRRKQLQAVVACIRAFSPHAFYTIEDVRLASRGNPASRAGAFSRPPENPK